MKIILILIGIIIAFIGTIGFDMLMENPNIEIGDCYDGYNNKIIGLECEVEKPNIEGMPGIVLGLILLFMIIIGFVLMVVGFFQFIFK